MRLGTNFLLSLLSVFCGAQVSFGNADRTNVSKIVLRDDDRVEASQATQSWVDSTVSFFLDGIDFNPGRAIRRGSRSPRHRVTLGTSPMNPPQRLFKRDRVCSTVPFQDQPAIAFCTGVLVGPKLVLTAAHCVNDAELHPDTWIAFGFSMGPNGRAPRHISATEVYRIAAIPRIVHRNRILDFALVELDRTVTNHRPIEVDPNPEAAPVGTPLITIGNPMGLPLKVTENMRSIGTYHPYYHPNLADAPSSNPIFYAQADIQTGNSGGPVIDPSTGKVVGVLTHELTPFIEENKRHLRHGNWVFDDTNACWDLLRCPGPLFNDHCTEESAVIVNRASLVAERIRRINAGHTQTTR